MSFFSLLPLAIEDLQFRPIISDAPNISWYDASGAVDKYWNITGIQIDIFAQAALSSSHIGLPLDFYETFHCNTITSDCVCAMQKHKRAKRNSKVFLEAKCDFAKLKVEGPFFKYPYPKQTSLLDVELGFKFDFEFNWYAMRLSTEIPKPEQNLIGFYGISFGGEINAYCPQYEGHIYSQGEIPHLEVSIQYLTS